MKNWKIAAEDAPNSFATHRLIVTEDWTPDGWAPYPVEIGEIVARTTDSPRQVENAHLIAAAPDLLAALELALRYLDKAVADDLMSGCVRPPSHAAEKARAAIALAKGETL